MLISKYHFEFYTCDLLRVELLRHRKKLLKLTKLSEYELAELEQIVTANITFINESLIAQKHFISAEKLTVDIDIDDTPFVALAKHLKGKLWTGDKILLNGLVEKGYKDVISSGQLFELFDELENR